MKPQNRFPRTSPLALSLVFALSWPCVAGSRGLAAAEPGFVRESLEAKAAWMARNLERLQAPEKPQPGLRVLANNDPVVLNGHGEEPLRIAGKAYPRGLYCHAVSKVLVTLPAPGESFTAVVGLDDKPDTRSGRGSVVFSVSAGDRTLFKSEVLRIGMPGVPVSVDLGGATSFLLEIGDAGDGIGWDQSVWGDAKIVLADGRELWVGDMEIREAMPPPIPFSFRYDGQDSSRLLAGWSLKVRTGEPDPNRTERAFSWTDPKTGLEVRCESVEYRNFPTVEWTLRIVNRFPVQRARYRRWAWPSCDPRRAGGIHKSA